MITVITVFILFISFICSLMLYMFCVDGYSCIDNALRTKKDFFKVCFLHQTVLWQQDEYINRVGIVVLEVLMTPFVLWINFMVFIVLCFCLIAKLIAYAFMKLFAQYPITWDDWWSDIWNDEAYRAWARCRYHIGKEM
jgi:hypothetical protein